ncbi:hypothetical protein ACP70R_044760 [Stipagrostis hirtigluma subsp. patula]
MFKSAAFCTLIALVASIAAAAAAPPPPPSPPPTSPHAPLRECLMALGPMDTCLPFLTHADVPAPPSDCCGGLQTVVRDSLVCLCHGLLGHDLSPITHLPIIQTRMLLLPIICLVFVPPTIIFTCAIQPVPPIRADPPPAAPSPPHSGEASP